MRTRPLDDVKAELDKCILVCRNCHGEIHYTGRIEGQQYPALYSIDPELFLANRLPDCDPAILAVITEALTAYRLQREAENR